MPALAALDVTEPLNWLPPSSFSLLGGKPKAPVSIDDDAFLDHLENGYLRESVTQECLTPRPAKHWGEYCLKRIGKDQFKYVSVQRGSWSALPLWLDWLGVDRAVGTRYTR
jgi:hypothetical protein